MLDAITHEAVSRLRIGELAKQKMLSGEISVQYFGGPRMGNGPWVVPSRKLSEKKRHAPADE